MNTNTTHHKRIIDAKLLASYKTKSHPFTDVPTVEKWLLYWLENDVKNTCKPTTYTNFHSYIHSHILPLIGDYKLNELSIIELQYYVDYKLEKGRLDHTGGLAIKTVKEHITLLKVALKKAVDQKIISMNPARYVEFTKEKKEEISVLETKEQTLIDQSIDLNWCPNSLLTIFLGEYAGLRIGEVAALRIEDLNFKKRLICVDESLNRVGSYDQNHEMKYTLRYGTPKSGRIRFVPMNEDLYKALKVYVNTMPMQLKKNPKNPLFTNSRGNVMEPRCITYHFKQFMETLGLDKYHFHCLRHTFATRSLELGMDVKSCSMILGHSSTKITQDLYIHVSEHQMRKEMKKLNMKAIMKIPLY